MGASTGLARGLWNQTAMLIDDQVYGLGLFIAGTTLLTPPETPR